MKLIPDLPKWALDALDAPPAFDETDLDRAGMGTAFGLDASVPPLQALTPEEAAAQDPLQRRLARRSGL